VHVSGSMFVMIPNSNWRTSDNMQSSDAKEPIGAESVSNPHEEYITRHFSGVRQTGERKENKKIKTGFLCSWNYMITKRWKTVATGDEAFMRKILADFTNFCSNDKGRLEEFWKDHHVVT